MRGVSSDPRTLNERVAAGAAYGKISLLMGQNSRVDPARLIGRSPQSLRPFEAAALVGKWIALEIYTPERAPLRRIEAVGDSVEECIRRLAERGLDPRRFEFTPFLGPY